MSDIVERLKQVPTQRAICGEAATEIELLRRVIAWARRLIVARGESMDVPLQFQQHRFLAVCDEIGIDAERESYE